MRKIILSVLGILLIVGAVLIANAIIASNTRVRPAPKKVVKTVFVDTVQNRTVPIVIKANGNLIAKRRLELYSEVQGILKPGQKLFKAGETFRQGQTILRLDASEFYASVQSQKSALLSQLTAIMPDLRLDYPEAYPKWQNYLDQFDMKKTLADLPDMTSEKEKYFISGRNILTAYYNIKNLEQRLGKYSIRAPFTGILTEALVTEGTLVRSGQKLGEFIDLGVYELQVAVNKEYGNLLEVGKQVRLNNMNKTKQYEGKVTRINGNVDLSSQTIDAFIEIRDEALREGMYLEALLNAREEENAISVDRSLLQSGNKLFVVKDSILDLQEVNPIFFSEKEVVLK
ncbi:MAG: HlyD family efflux transporter periplasmic adaptor subunit, partial [Bacteroidia bacterium]|nr:HlyD family efflux transporter periplasmic adaptor subunit [Bacteroidia bacterium]